MFPQYKDLTQYPWNGVVLTARQHLIAHIMLWKAYPSNIGCMLGVFRSSKNNTKQLRGERLVINTKLWASVREDLSKAMRGKFSRGYNPDGSPNISEKTRQILSAQKLALYANEENRRKHGVACTGVKRTTVQGIIEYANNRTPEHAAKLKSSVVASINKRVQDHYSGVATFFKTKVVYVTPFGNFTQYALLSRYGTYCKAPDKPFNNHHLKKNPCLNQGVHGVTPRSLGFRSVYLGDPDFESVCVNLNRVVQPPPNHILLCEINDFLSRGTFLIQ
jgi:hypothetical protein